MNTGAYDSDDRGRDHACGPNLWGTESVARRSETKGGHRGQSVSATLRTATRDDAGPAAQILPGSRRVYMLYARGPRPDDDVHARVRDVLIAGGDVTRACVNERPVGILVLGCEDRTGWVRQFDLDPDYDGRGIGAALLAHARPVLPRPIRLYAFQRNTGARRFDERRGLRAIVFSDGASNEDLRPDVLYELVP